MSSTRPPVVDPRGRRRGSGRPRAARARPRRPVNNRASADRQRGRRGAGSTVGSPFFVVSCLTAERCRPRRLLAVRRRSRSAREQSTLRAGSWSRTAWRRISETKRPSVSFSRRSGFALVVLLRQDPRVVALGGGLLLLDAEAEVEDRALAGQPVHVLAPAEGERLVEHVEHALPEAPSRVERART